MEQDIILSLRDITKVYPGVVALDHVSIDFRRGEVHALVGENGAGKSTMIKVITGAIHPEQGSIVINGEEFSQIAPDVAHKHGIEAIYQEFNLVDSLSVAENVSFGVKHGRTVNYKKLNQIAKEVFDRFGMDLDPTQQVFKLTSAQMQLVEIAKSITKGAKFLIMDEPTAPLTVSEIDILMSIVHQLKEEGVTILYISHRLDEIFRIADRATVLRDGKFVVTRSVAETTRKQLVADMVGRELSEQYPVRRSEPGEVTFEVKNLTGNSVKNISFQARAGEIVGVAGLVGAGRSEIMKVIFGAEKAQWGEIYIRGQKAEINSCYDALKYGLGFVPEDRKREGCFLFNSVAFNTTFNRLKKISRGLFGLFIDFKEENRLYEFYHDKLEIRTPNAKQNVLNLSGGNQQKVVITKMLAGDADILIFDEPTRGIDVGSKHEIYELMNDLCAEGKTIIMVTSDMEELLGMSDRVVVLYEHQMAGEISDRNLITQENVLELASGGSIATVSFGKGSTRDE